MENLQEIKERLQISIDFSKENNEDLEERNWVMQDGVLLSVNEASLILSLLNSSLWAITYRSGEIITLFRSEKEAIDRFSILSESDQSKCQVNEVLIEEE